MIRSAAFVFLALAASGAAAQSIIPKIGYIDGQRIVRDSAPSLAASKKMEADFRRRDDEIAAQSEQLKRMQEALERNSVTLSEAERRRREREIEELGRELERRQANLREDIDQRRREETTALGERVNRVIREIADKEGYDIIFQDAVMVSPRIDLTDKVLKALEEESPPGK